MDFLNDIPLSVKVITGIITILSAIIGASIYIAKTFYGTKQLEKENKLLSQSLETLKKDKEQSEEKIVDYQSEISSNIAVINSLRADVQALNQYLIALRKGKEDALNVLHEIDKLLLEARTSIEATEGSILIENPFIDRILSFLIIHGDKEAILRRYKVKIDGTQAGEAFIKGETQFYSKDLSEIHDDKVDIITGYQTEYMISAPLKIGNKTIGVLQLLKKDKPFGMKDLLTINNLIPEITFKVQLVNNPETLKALGIVEPTDEIEASILFADITNFSSLFFQKKISIPEILEMTNDYYNRLIDIGLKNECFIDKTLGDGFMLHFKGTRENPNFALSAFKSAIDMQKEFNKIRQEWFVKGRPVGNIYHRIGVATGSVTGGNVGHRQFLLYTVIGDSVNNAARLCSKARGKKDNILICNYTFELVKQYYDLNTFNKFHECDKQNNPIYEVIF